MSTAEVRFDRDVPVRRQNDDGAKVHAKPEDREAFASKLEETQSKDDDVSEERDAEPRGAKRPPRARGQRAVDDATIAAMLSAPPGATPRAPSLPMMPDPQGELDLTQIALDTNVARNSDAPIGDAPKDDAPAPVPVVDVRATLAMASMLPFVAPGAAAPIEVAAMPAAPKATIASPVATPVLDAARTPVLGVEAPAKREDGGAPEIVARPEIPREARVERDAPEVTAPPLDATPRASVPRREAVAPHVDAKPEAPAARVDREVAARAPRPVIQGQAAPALAMEQAAIIEAPRVAGALASAIEAANEAPNEEPTFEVAAVDPRIVHEPSARANAKDGVGAPSEAAAISREAMAEVPDRHAAAVAVSRLTRERAAHAEVDVPELGRIAVTARAHAREVDVALTAPMASVDVLRAAGGDLASSLRDAKIPLGSLHIGAQSSGGQGPSSHGDGQRHAPPTEVDRAEIAARSGPARRVRFVL